MARSAAWSMAALVCLVVVTQTGMQAARPLVSYRTIALGGGGLAVGVAAASFAMLSVLVAMPLGRYTDRTGRTPRLLAAGTVLCIGSAAALALAPTLALVAGASALLGFAHVLLMVGAQNHVARLSGDSVLDRNFGYLTAAVAGGQLLGPLLAGLVLGGGDLTAAATARASLWAGLVVVAALPVLVALWRLSPRPSVPLASGTGEAAPASRPATWCVAPAYPQGCSSACPFSAPSTS